MKAIIITIGDEILLGQILDTNSRFIAGHLTLAGIEVTEMRSVADRRDEIYEAVDYAMNEAELVIVTGGLGPTKDDVTKKVLAEYFGSKLTLNPEVMVWLEELLRGRGIALNENNKSQAVLPDNCRVLRNFKGTASGMWFERGWKSLISLPGVPFEMEHLMETYVLPELKRRYPHLQLAYRMLQVYDIPESELAERLSSWEEALPEGLGLAYLPSPGLVKLRITAKGKAVEKLEAYYETLKESLTGLYYTEGEADSVEKQFGECLRKRNLTVATAESCTGGYIAHLITSVAGSSDYFKGSVVAYANEVKNKVLGVDMNDIERYGAVSGEVVKQMAEGVKRVMGTDYAVATSGVAGPAGGTPEKPVGTVWIAAGYKNEIRTYRQETNRGRAMNIERAGNNALLILRDLLK